MDGVLRQEASCNAYIINSDWLDEFVYACVMSGQHRLIQTTNTLCRTAASLSTDNAAMIAVSNNKRFTYPRGACCVLLVVLMLCTGCRINLPSQTHSNLWARAVEDRADWNLWNAQHYSNPTHRSKAMSDWTKGYYRGYHTAAFCFNQLPASQYPAVWAPERGKHNSDEQAIQAGYNAGFQQASFDGLVNSVPPKQ